METVLVTRLVQFAWLEARSCLFAVAVFAGLLVTHVLPLPIAAYDAMLLWCVAVVGHVVLRRTAVHFTVGGDRYRMPLALSFALIGLFLWIAENLATYLGAWRNPNRLDVWESVHTSKIGAWALSVTMSFVLVATVKAQEGRLYHRPEE